MKSIEFAFDCVQLIYYKYHKINPNREGSCIDSPDWIRNKKATINSINQKDNKRFQYAITVTLINKKLKGILKFSQYHKSDKTSCIIYADFESLIVKVNGCKNNAENSSAAKVSEHIPSGFSMSTISSFNGIENKHDIYRDKDCMKKHCES